MLVAAELVRSRPAIGRANTHLEGEVLDRYAERVQIRLLAEQARIEGPLAAAAQLRAVVRLVPQRREG